MLIGALKRVLVAIDLTQRGHRAFRRGLYPKLEEF